MVLVKVASNWEVVADVEGERRWRVSEERSRVDGRGRLTVLLLKLRYIYEGQFLIPISGSGVDTRAGFF